MGGGVKEILALAADLGKQAAPRLKQFSLETFDVLVLLGEDLEEGDLEEARMWLDAILEETAYETGNLKSSSQLLLGVGAVLALLLQHIAVTFSSLTLVREWLLGAEEVFRVAPIAPWEIITGKYMSYSLLTLTIAGVLSFLIVGLMGVPLLGNLAYFVLVLILLTVASLGWGVLTPCSPIARASRCNLLC
jgi:ABC-type multidrug transport system permease subunit